MAQFLLKALCSDGQVASISLQQPNMLCSQLCRLSDGAIHGLAFEQRHAQGRRLLGFVKRGNLLDNLYFGAAPVRLADLAAI